MPVDILNGSRIPRDLADGRLVAPGELVENVELTDHERSMVESGALLAIDRAGRKVPPSRVKPSTSEAPEITNEKKEGDS